MFQYAKFSSPEANKLVHIQQYLSHIIQHFSHGPNICLGFAITPYFQTKSELITYEVCPLAFLFYSDMQVKALKSTPVACTEFWTWYLPHGINAFTNHAWCGPRSLASDVHFPKDLSKEYILWPTTWTTFKEQCLTLA